MPRWNTIQKPLGRRQRNSQPGYVITSGQTVVPETEIIFFSITVRNITANTTFYWTVSGTVTDADFTQSNGTITTSNIALTSREVFNIEVVPKNDLMADGPETLILQLRSGSVSGPILANSSPITITDRSYLITPDSTNVNENAVITYTIQTFNVPDGTVVYWTNNGTTNAGDISDGLTSGNITITNGTASLYLLVIPDQITEGDETVIINLRADSTTGRIIGTAPTVFVADTSKGAAYYISESTTAMFENETVTFTVTTERVPDNSVIYWTNDGPLVLQTLLC